MTRLRVTCLDKAWVGRNGSRGRARLVGSLAVVHDRPRRNDLLVFRATVTAFGIEGWTVDRLCDDALGWAGLTLATRERVELGDIPVSDPFRLPAQRGEGSVPSMR